MKIIHKNKKAFFDYEVLEQFKAGVMLLGPEIKSVRLGNVNLKGSYISLQDGKPVLKGANIARYKYDQAENYDSFRDRTLLMNKAELIKIEKHLNTQGVTIVPLEIGLDGRYAKLMVGIVRGKKKFDKREVIKRRQSDREIGRAMKRYK